MIDNKDFNEYLHKLLIKPYDEELTTEDMLEIRKIVLNKYNLNNEEIYYDYADFAHFINLENCSLEFMDLANELVAALSLLPVLKNIEISFSTLMSSIKFKNKFESIVLNSVSQDVLELFENVENVKRMMLLNIEDLDAIKLEKFSNVEELCIYNSKLTNTLAITKLSKLRNLKLDGTEVEGELALIAKLAPDVMVQHNEKYHPEQ